MNQEHFESLKGMSKEERAEYFRAHKSELLSADALKSVNGGATTNPNSEVPFDGNWYSSFGFVCQGNRFCG